MLLGREARCPLTAAPLISKLVGGMYANLIKRLAGVGIGLQVSPATPAFGLKPPLRLSKEVGEPDAIGRQPRALDPDANDL